MRDNTAMEALGFRKGMEVTLPRMIVALSGYEKTGKTHFALTAPGPIAFFNLDIGVEGVLNKYTKDKEIMVFDVNMDAAVAKEEWDRFKAALLGVMKLPKIRTIVIDTEGDAWECIRQARLGRLTQVMPFQYTVVNAEYKGLMKAAYACDKNLILLRKRKPVYINDKRTKESEPVGFGDMGYISQINAVMTRDDRESPPEFTLTVEDCRQNIALVGMEFTGPMCNWEFLQTFVLGE